MADNPSGRPEGLRFISGVILVSRQPGRVTEFYRDVLGLPLLEEQHGETQLHWGCELGDVHFAIHPAEDYPEDPAGGPSPVKLAFMVFDLPGMVAWLDRCGIPLCYPPADLGEESQITAVRDPDGNLVELTQLGPGWLGHLKAHRAEGNDLVSAWDARLAQLADPGPGRGAAAATPLPSSRQWLPQRTSKPQDHGREIGLTRYSAGHLRWRERRE
jgi:catechol 2,3-dioxygenase-like lactoylglutathione lyase family enzyme